MKGPSPRRFPWTAPIIMSFQSRNGEAAGDKFAIECSQQLACLRLSDLVLDGDVQARALHILWCQAAGEAVRDPGPQRHQCLALDPQSGSSPEAHQ